ncbi:MAG: HNH endonuclease [Synergistaceae bacterium]|nr:HNH endonuclease [Synergistaceae bacterium]
MDLVTVIIIAAIIVSLVAILIRNGVLVLRIKKRSKLYKELTLLNANYKSIFLEVGKTSYSIDYPCKSLQTYRNRNNIDSIMSYLVGYMKEQSSTWNALYEKIFHNIRYEELYQREYHKLADQHSGTSFWTVKGKSWLSEKRYKKYEGKICTKTLIKPITEIKINCTINYTSPKAQSSYSTTWATDLLSVAARIRQQSEAEQSIGYQRALMTSSKRYDILRRDGFRCKVCGRSAAEGAKLEVDHILPVSKGGKTTDDNLQTLCRECNQGKSAKLG